MSGSIVIVNSRVENSFNKVQSLADEDTAQALKKLADIVKSSENVAAISLFNSFNEEIQKEKVDKNKLGQYWDALRSILPDVSSMVGIISKIIGLF